MNNLTKLLVITFISVFLASCGEDPIPQPDKNEEYTRAFIKEFGTPQAGHDFSMAKSAGLRVKTSKPMQISITGVSDGTEYLFGQLVVPAGETPLPVTIPSDITDLYIKAGPHKYTVSADGILDLDNPTPSQARTISYNQPDGSNTHPFEVVDNHRPTIIFDNNYDSNNSKTKNNIGIISSTTGWNKKLGTELFEGKNMWPCESSLGSYQQGEYGDVVYDIFPIYWNQQQTGTKNIEVYLHEINQDYKMKLDFSENPAVDPFPDLGWSNTIDHSTITLDNLSDYFTFNTADHTKAFGELGASAHQLGKTIVSKGFTVIVKESIVETGVSFDVVYKDPATGKTCVSSSNPYINYDEWGDNYYNFALQYLPQCYGSSRRIFLKSSLTTAINFNYDIYYTEDDDPVNKTANSLVYAINFTRAAMSPNEVTYPSQNLLSLLVIPRGSHNVLAELYDRKPEPYYWTLAAEDLGGTYDWDYNDAVFTFTDQLKNLNTENVHSEKTILWGPKDAVSVREISVTPLAAGGTLPIYITFNGDVSESITIPTGTKEDDSATTTYGTANTALKDKYVKPSTTAEGETINYTTIIGKELHKWLGGSTHKRAINVGANHDPRAVGPTISFSIALDESLADLKKMHGTADSQKGKKDTALLGFSVLVDPDNTLESLELAENGLTPVSELVLGEGIYVVGGISDDESDIAPRMIAVKGHDWQWPREGHDIRAAYPNFKTWIGNSAYTNWCNTPDTNHVTRK